MEKTFKQESNEIALGDLYGSENCVNLDNNNLITKPLLQNLCDNIVDSVTIEEDKESCNGSHNQYWKTKLCLMFSKGICKNGDDCRFAHGNDELRSPVNLRKTKLCPFWLNSSCDIGENCPFAHGTSELRVTNDFYKTSVCRYWKMGVRCDAGVLCRHAHGESELRKKINKHDIHRKEFHSNKNSSNAKGNKSSGNYFIFQVPPPLFKNRSSLKAKDNSENYFYKNRESLSFSLDKYSKINTEMKMKRNYTYDDIFNNSNKFNLSFENRNDLKNYGILRNSISMQSLDNWNALDNGFGDNRGILLNSNPGIENSNNDNLLLKTETSFGKNCNFLSNKAMDDDNERQYLEYKSTETDISSFCSLKRVENSSNSLASNISDMSLNDDNFVNNWQGKLQNQSFLKYSHSSLLNLFYPSQENHLKNKTLRSTDNLSGDMKLEGITTIDYLKDISEKSISENCNLVYNQSITYTPLEINLPILVKIKLLDSSEVSSLSIGEVPAILIPSEDMKSAKIHFLSA